MKIDYTRISLFQRCPRLYFYRYVKNLAPARDPVPLIIGRALHDGLAAHYTDQDTRAAIKASYDEVREGTPWLSEELEHLARQEDYMQEILQSYKAHYATEDFTFLAHEVIGEIPFNGHILAFRTDGAVSLNEKPWLLEHKSTGRPFTQLFFDRIRMSGQTMIYQYGVHQSINLPVVGIIINGISYNKRTFKGMDFRRDTAFHDSLVIASYLRTIRDTISEIDRLTKSAEDEAWRMHREQCSGWNRLCDFSILCRNSYGWTRPELLESFKTRQKDYTEEDND